MFHIVYQGFEDDRPNCLAYLCTLHAHQPGVLRSDLVEHLEYLTERCSEMNTGHNEFKEGKAGLTILGYITLEEVKSLRSMLLGSGWMVSREEPLDGGVRDAVRHLNALLMAAERRSAGLIHRQHE